MSKKSQQGRPAWAVVLPVVGLGLIGCGPGPVPVEVVDLVAEFRYAEVRRERPLIDLGTPSAVAPLVGGWSWNETDPQGATFVWAVGPRSEVGVFLAWARDVEVRMRCRAFRYPDAPAQVLDVLWDDEKVASLELEAGLKEDGFIVPAERATAGSHRLSLVPAYFGRPEKTEDAGQPPKRRLSFACDWIEVGDGPNAGQARGEGETLWIPAAGEAAFFLEPEQDLELQWEGIAPRGVSRVDVVWEVEGAAPVTGSFTQGSAQPLHLPLPPEGEEAANGADDDWLASVRPARLTLRVPAGGAAPGGEELGVVLRRPRLTADGRGLPVPDRAAEQWSFDAPGVTAPPSPVGARQPESILLWIVDTLRVDRLGLYGHDRPVSPNYDALANQSTVFERAVAQSSWTRPTVASLLTGVGPKRHGISDVTHHLDESFLTLPERLQEFGYATAGFSSNVNFSEASGLDQGFDRFEFVHDHAQGLVERSLEWLDELAEESPGQPFFLTVLSIEPHASFQPAEPFRGRFAPDVDDSFLGTVEHLRALADRKAPATDEVVEKLFRLYDGEIAWNDHMFGEFRRELEQRGMDPLVVVIADHGEAFKERGVFGHAWDLHREVMDVPFLIHRPGQLEGRRVRVPVQQVDLLPTLLEVAGGGPVLGGEGDSLLPLVAPESPAVDANTMRPFDRRLLVSTTDRFHRPFASLIRGRYKLIEPLRGGDMPERQLFDWFADPEEEHDLAPERPLLAGVLARLLREELDLAALDRVEAVEVELDEETRRRLRALGYIE